MFFPSMGEFTIHHFRATSFNVKIQILELPPMFTIVSLVFQFSVNDDFSSEILLIVCIYTMKSIMRIIKRTHNCFVIEHVEVRVFLFFVQKMNPKFSLKMNKGTEISINTLVGIIEISTIAGFKSVLMVHLFYNIMRKSAIFLATLKIALFTSVIGFSSFIIIRVVVNTLFKIVKNLRMWARFSFETIQVARVCVICQH